MATSHPTVDEQVREQPESTRQDRGERMGDPDQSPVAALVTGAALLSDWRVFRGGLLAALAAIVAYGALDDVQPLMRVLVTLMATVLGAGLVGAAGALAHAALAYVARLVHQPRARAKDGEGRGRA